MSEFQPNDHEEEPVPRIHLEAPDGSKYECTPENTTVFMHTDEPKYDFLFVETGHEDSDTAGECFWRENFNNFEQLIEWMSEHEYSIIEVADAADVVREIYGKYKAAKDAREAVATVKDNDPDKHLTPRQARRVAFLGYLLLKDYLRPEDFADENKSAL